MVKSAMNLHGLVKKNPLLKQTNLLEKLLDLAKKIVLTGIQQKTFTSKEITLKY